MKTLARLAAFLLFVLASGLASGLAMAQTPAAPEPAPAGVTEVRIGAYINDIQAIDLRTHSFVADVYIWFRDSDPELEPGKTFELMNKFAPDDHVQTALYDEPQPQPDGSQYELFRHQGPFSAKFSVKTYPFDGHLLAVDIEDAQWTSSRLVYVADEIAMNPNIELPGFIIGKPELRIVNQPYPTAFGDLANPEVEPYSRAAIVLPISRPVLSGVIKSLLPVFIVVLVSAAALLLSPSHVEARVGLAITALLTLVALQFNASQGLPDVGYLLMLDQVYLASYGFVLLVVTLLVQTTSAEDEAKAEGRTKILPRAGWMAAFLAVLLYAAVISLVLWFNLATAGASP